MELKMQIVKEVRNKEFKLYTCDTNIGHFIAFKNYEDNKLTIKFTGKVNYRDNIERFRYRHTLNKWETEIEENERTVEVFEEFIKRFFYRNKFLQLSLF